MNALADLLSFCAIFMAVAFLFWLIVNLVAGTWKKWAAIQAQFPPLGTHNDLVLHKRVFGRFGNSSHRYFTVAIVPEGLVVRPAYAPNSPVLIPWDKIQSVRQGAGLPFIGGGNGMSVQIDCEPGLRLLLPLSATDVLKRHIPDSKFFTAPSLGETINKIKV